MRPVPDELDLAARMTPCCVLIWRRRFSDGPSLVSLIAIGPVTDMKDAHVNGDVGV